MSDDAGETVPKDYDALVKEYEEKFSDRYTENDDDFAATLNKKNVLPPCIYPWYNKPRRNFDYSRGNDHRPGDRHSNYRYHPYHKPAWDHSRYRGSGRDRDNQGGREGSSRNRDRHPKTKEIN